VGAVDPERLREHEAPHGYQIGRSSWDRAERRRNGSSGGRLAARSSWCLTWGAWCAILRTRLARSERLGGTAMVRYTCSCGKSYLLPDHRAGTRTTCPHCGQRGIVPTVRAHGLAGDKGTPCVESVPREEADLPEGEGVGPVEDLPPQSAGGFTQNIVLVSPAPHKALSAAGWRMGAGQRIVLFVGGLIAVFMLLWIPWRFRKTVERWERLPTTVEVTEYAWLFSPPRAEASPDWSRLVAQFLAAAGGTAVAVLGLPLAKRLNARQFAVLGCSALLLGALFAYPPWRARSGEGGIVHSLAWRAPVRVQRPVFVSWLDAEPARVRRERLLDEGAVGKVMEINRLLAQRLDVLGQIEANARAIVEKPGVRLDVEKPNSHLMAELNSKVRALDDRIAQINLTPDEARRVQVHDPRDVGAPMAPLEELDMLNRVAGQYARKMGTIVERLDAFQTQTGQKGWEAWGLPWEPPENLVVPNDWRFRWDVDRGVLALECGAVVVLCVVLLVLLRGGRGTRMLARARLWRRGAQ